MRRLAFCTGLVVVLTGLAFVFFQPKTGQARGEGFVSVPGGLFVMGDPLDGLRDARPHEVRLSPFQMSSHEVTGDWWEKVVAWARQHGYTDLALGSFKTNNHPVYGIAWLDVVKWCNARSEMEGLTPCYYLDESHTEVLRTGLADVTSGQVLWQAEGYRLPTEAEWEMAARGGLVGRRFPWGDVITHDLANYSGTLDLEYDHSQRRGAAAALATSLPHTAPVGSFPPNGLGLHDMAGNVAEWCWDFYDPNYGLPVNTAPGPIEDPRGPKSGIHCVVRGGSWRHTAADARCASRFDLPGSPQLHVGFRLVRK